MTLTQDVAIVWIRNDFRFHDNQAIFEAVQTSQHVLLLYLLPPKRDCKTVAHDYEMNLLHSFGAKAIQLGFGWCILEGRQEAIATVVKKHHVTSVFWNYQGDCDDTKVVKQSLEKMNVFWKECRGNFLVHPEQLLNRSGTPWKVFSPFYHAICSERLDMLEYPCVRPRKKCVCVVPSLKVQSHQSFVSGEEVAQEKLHLFCLHGLKQYAKNHDQLKEGVTSKLSSHLRFGEISIRHIWNTVVQIVPKTHEFLRQLVWREFCYYILYHFPEVTKGPYQQKFKKMSWRYDKGELLRWKEGSTGVPIVDAGMRQLYLEGWIPNRMRMITASFLVKHLLHSWEEGMEWYMERLIDADCANNTFGWQWVAGCGVDACPFFRIFQPNIQALKFDPHGSYVRKFIPELEDVSHPLNGRYPSPMVDLKSARQRALLVYSRLRKGSYFPESD